MQLTKEMNWFIYFDMEIKYNKMLFLTQRIELSLLF